MLASDRCTLRYAEFAYGSNTPSVNRFPAASFSSERTSDVICPAVLYADVPTTGIIASPGAVHLACRRGVHTRAHPGVSPECRFPCSLRHLASVRGRNARPCAQRLAHPQRLADLY